MTENILFVHCCCRYLATGCSFKTLGYSFRMSDVTVGRIVKETCEAIWDNLHVLHIPFPKEDEVEPIVQGFWNKWKFLNCVGCIDGRHVRLRIHVIRVVCSEIISSFFNRLTSCSWSGLQISSYSRRGLRQGERRWCFFAFQPFPET